MLVNCCVEDLIEREGDIDMCMNSFMTYWLQAKEGLGNAKDV